MTFEEYVCHDATSLAQLVAKKEISAQGLEQAARIRLDEVNPHINAVIHTIDKSAGDTGHSYHEEAPFAGVPFLLKNLPDGASAGLPMTMGCRCLRDNKSNADSNLVARYRTLGVNIIGLTNTPELGLMATTEPELHGVTRNPWQLAHSAGGSSGGAAAAVAAGIVPVAHANDGGGSIRIPASACGLFGLKPSRGRMPLGPGPAEVWSGFAMPHVISRSVRDSHTFYRGTCGPDGGAPYQAIEGERVSFDQPLRRLRIAKLVHPILGERVHGDCRKANDDSANLLSSLGHYVEEVDLALDRERLRLAYLMSVASCTAADLLAIGRQIGRALKPGDVEPATWFMGQIGRVTTGAELEDARNFIGLTTRMIARFHESYDLIMCPTMSYPPARIGELLPSGPERLALTTLQYAPIASVMRRSLSSIAGRMFERTPNTMIFNMTGQPAMSVPLAVSPAGLPIGIQFAGPVGGEELLFALAYELEHARPWFSRRPPEPRNANSDMLTQ